MYSRNIEQSEMAPEREVSEEPASSYDEADMISVLDEEEGSCFLP
jgi:hypothetical protein